MPKIIADMPDPDVPASSWRDYGEIVLCEDREELCRVVRHTQFSYYGFMMVEQQQLENLGKACVFCGWR